MIARSGARSALTNERSFVASLLCSRRCVTADNAHRLDMALILGTTPVQELHYGKSLTDASFDIRAEDHAQTVACSRIFWQPFFTASVRKSSGYYT